MVGRNGVFAIEAFDRSSGGDDFLSGGSTKAVSHDGEGLGDAAKRKDFYFFIEVVDEAGLFEGLQIDGLTTLEVF